MGYSALSLLDIPHLAWNGQRPFWRGAATKPSACTQLQNRRAAGADGTPRASRLPETMTTKRQARPKTAPAQQEAIYVMQAEICRVLGHPRRIQILDLLAGGQKSTTQLLGSLGVGKVNLSQHLALLKRAGLVETLHQGRATSYRLSFTEIKDACRLIREVLAVRLRRGSRLARSLGKRASAQTFTS